MSKYPLMRNDVTQEQAIALCNADWWLVWTDEDFVAFQLFEERLCCNFGDFQLALTRCLGHPVFTHQLVTMHEALTAEFIAKYPEAYANRAVPQIQHPDARAAELVGSD